MSFPLLLTKKNYDPYTGRMLYQFPSNQTFSGKEVALINASFYNSFFNITAAYNNNKLTVIFPTFTSGPVTSTGSPVPTLSRTLTLADGYYSLDTLNQALQNFCINEGLYYYDTATGMNVYFVQIQANSTLYAVQVNCFLVPTVLRASQNGWVLPSNAAFTPNGGTVFVAPQLELPSGLATLIGFQAGTYADSQFRTQAWSSSPTVFLGAAAPTINQVSSLIMRTTLINQSTGNPADMLALVPITSEFGAITQFVAAHPVFSPVSNGTHPTVEIIFTDQGGNRLFLRDPDITLTMEIRDQKA